MKVNFNRNFKNYKGEETKESMKDIVCKTLFLSSEGLTPEEMYLAYKLSSRIMPSKEDVEITTEEASFIKKVCAKSLTPGGYGSVYDLLEGGC